MSFAKRLGGKKNPKNKKNKKSELTTLSLEEDLAMTQKGMGARAPTRKHQFRFLYSPEAPNSLEDPTRPHNVMAENVLLVIGHDHAPDSTHIFSTLSNNQYAQAKLTSPPSKAPHNCNYIINSKSETSMRISIYLHAGVASSPFRACCVLLETKQFALAWVFDHNNMIGFITTTHCAQITGL
jgi:hypothetical protein